MFKKLTVENFKSHKKTELDFHPGVNVIVGDPQSGKTNISRALLLLTTNRPLGADYLPHFAGEEGTTKIRLKVSEGPVITLKKRIGITRAGERVVREAVYSLGEQEYQGMNKDVPDVISSLLNLGELNLQRQFDSPYLILSSPGEVARAFNKITRLERVDDWVRGFTTKVNSANSEITLLSDQAESTKVELEKYKNIERERVTLKRLVTVDNELSALRKRHYTLDQQLISLEKVGSVVSGLEPSLEAEPLLEQAEDLDRELDADRMKEYILQQVLALDGEIEKLSSCLVVEEDLRGIEKLEMEIKGAINQNQLLSELVELEEENKLIQESFQQTLRTYTEELAKSRKCPTCFSVIDEARMRAVVKELEKGGTQ
jgi:DNA repair protein SbcC/Rad50